MNRGRCGSPTCSWRNKSPRPTEDVTNATSGLHVALGPHHGVGHPTQPIGYQVISRGLRPFSRIARCHVAAPSVGYSVVAVQTRRVSDCFADLNTVSKTDSGLLDTKARLRLPLLKIQKFELNNIYIYI